MASFLNSTLLAGIEPILNRVIQLDPDVEPLLQPLNGKTLAIALTDIGLEFTVLFNLASITLMDSLETAANTTLKAPTLSLLRYAHNPTQSLKPLNIHSSGDVQTLTPLLTLLQKLEPDWEEALAQRIGDSAATQVGYWARQLLNWTHQSRHRFSHQTKTFFAQGDRHLVTRAELIHFFDQIDALNIDSERLELKIARLERQRATAQQNATAHRKETTP
jgi:ubiquinone biosynthesis accessory factor UbiJ